MLLTFQTTEFTHASEHRGLHFDVAHSGRIRSGKVVLLVLLGVGAERSVQPGLAWSKSSTIRTPSHFK